MFPPASYSTPRFGQAVKILADTRDEAHDLGATMRDLEISRGLPASLMEFTFDPDTFYMFSGPELLAATEPPQDLQDQLDDEGYGYEERERRLLPVMQDIHRRLAGNAEVYDFRLLPSLSDTSADRPGGWQA